MVATLTENALKLMVTGGNVTRPVLQVLSVKKIPAGDRIRINLSDGRHEYSYCILKTQLNYLYNEGKLTDMSIIRIDQFLIQNSNGRKIMSLLSVDVLHTGTKEGLSKIGAPSPIGPDGEFVNKDASSANQPTANSDKKRNATAADLPSVASPAKRSPLVPTVGGVNKTVGGGRSGDVGGGAEDLSQSPIFPLAMLTPYQNKWTVKVRITNKSDIRRWNNSRGEGHLCSVDVLDASGQMRATLFKEQCDKFYDVLEVGKVYYISGATLKAANPQFNTTNSDYEMTFRESTVVQPCVDASVAKDIPTQQFDFVAIKDVANLDKDAVVDVLGVCHKAGDAVSFISSRTQKELVKRELTLVDDSLAECSLTLFGSKAESFDATGHPVLAVKAARVSHYMSAVSLSALSSTVVQVNPDLARAYELKGWFETVGAAKLGEEGAIASLSASTGGLASFQVSTNSPLQPDHGGTGGQSGGDLLSNAKTLGEVRIERIGTRGEGGRPEFYSTSAYVIAMQKERALYQACPRTGPDGKACNKKVLDQQNGLYRCEKCNDESDSFVWRLILSVSLADATGHVWATCFQEQAETILGVSAQELGELSATDQDKYNAVFQAANLRQFNFRLSGKADNYNDEMRVKHTVRQVAPVDYEAQRQRQTAALKAV